MLKPAIKLSGITSSGNSIYLSDATGTYNAGTNPGGYGTPNPASPPPAVGLRMKNWGEETDYLNFATADNAFITDILTSYGRKLEASVLGIPVYRAGVHQVRYYPFETKDTIVTLTSNSKVVTVTAGTIPTAFDPLYKAVLILNGSTIISSVLIIDQTVAYSSTTFTLLKPWNGTTASGLHIKLATEADLKILITQPLDKCLIPKIGALASTKSCDPSDILLYTRLLMWKLSSQIKFDCHSYTEADEMIALASTECNKCPDHTCKTCS